VLTALRNTGWIALTAVLLSSATAFAGHLDVPARGDADCRFAGLELPADVAIYAAGGYGGASQTFQIDQSGHQAGRFDVTVNSPRPVVLILGAYNPSVWSIQWTTATKILAVVATGYYRQAVAGLPRSVPILAKPDGGEWACGGGYIAAQETELTWINPLSRKLFGKPAEQVFFAAGGKVTVGEPVPPDAKLVSSPEITVESFIDKHAPLAGPMGIRDAVAKGLLRPATEDDLDQWAAEVAKRKKPADVPPISGRPTRTPRIDLSRAFVVRRAMTLPAGLYGGDSVILYVPKGVPYPKGDPGHCTIYDLNSMRTSGPGAYHDE
jgi:hypothetical protein